MRGKRAGRGMGGRRAAIVAESANYSHCSSVSSQSSLADEIIIPCFIHV